jgi:hypothetical protein
MEGTGHDGGHIQLDGLTRTDICLNDAAFDDDRGHVDLAFDLGPLADDEHVLAADLAPKCPVDTHSPLELELSFEAGSLAQEGGDLGGGKRAFHRAGNVALSRPVRSERQSWRMGFRPALRGFLALTVVTGCLLEGRSVHAQDASALATDRQNQAEVKPGGPEPPKLPFRDSWFIWDNAVTTQTLGVGSDYQSADPTYEMSFSLRPRYYFWDTEKAKAYVGGRIDLIREFTNSDVTTRQGETTLSDTTLLMGYRRTLIKSGSSETWLLSSLPILTLPTSKFSIDNGTSVGVGGGVRLSQDVPLAGDEWKVFKRLSASVFAGYTHTFTRSTVPTNPELRRVRLEPEGRTFPGDQLTGAAFPEHEVRLDARLIMDVTEDVSLWLEGSYRPTWVYGFGDQIVRTQTGSAPALRATDPTTYVVTTGFLADLYYHVMPELSVGVGYEAVNLQPGPDGLRRSIFYGPSAQFHLVLVAYLDALYQTASGNRGGHGRLNP